MRDSKEEAAKLKEVVELWEQVAWVSSRILAELGDAGPFESFEDRAR